MALLSDAILVSYLGGAKVVAEFYLVYKIAEALVLLIWRVPNRWHRISCKWMFVVSMHTLSYYPNRLFRSWCAIVVYGRHVRVVWITTGCHLGWRGACA